MNSHLSEQERIALKTRHKQERDRRVCDRIKAVLLYDRGWSYRQIAEALLLSDEGVRKHVQEYKSSRKLETSNGGSISKLSDDQARDLKSHLQEHTYLYVKDIVEYVMVHYGITYTVPGMTNWLKGSGFSYKKPAVVPGKANRKAQEDWIEGYEKLKKTLGSNDKICFIDGVHPTHNSKLAYGWIRKGERKELLTNTGRQRINLSGAIDIDSRKVLVKEDKTLNADSTISFLKALEEFYPESEKIHAFCDNAKYYKNKAVNQYLETSKVKMHFLPPYSPNLNPIERLWKFMNERILYNKYYEKFAGFKSAVLRFFETLADPPKHILDPLKTRITDNFRVVGHSFANS